MDITYLGHSAFKLRGKDATVITDPYAKSVGLTMPKVNADIVTVSHDHEDHNFIAAVTGTSRRPEPFIIKAPGEYEVSGVSVFGISAFHDNVGGKDRGKNIIFVIHLDGVTVGHLGDLGHLVTAEQLAELSVVDVLLCPVGGVYSLGPEQAPAVVDEVSPAIVVPMHYATAGLNPAIFGQLKPVEDFIKALGLATETLDKLTVSPATIPEETTLIVLANQAHSRTKIHS